MTTEIISPDLKTILRRLRLSRILDTLPERLVLARQQKMPHQDWLLLILSDEATRRDTLSVTLRVQKAHLDPSMHLEAWDPTAKVTFGVAEGISGIHIIVRGKVPGIDATVFTAAVEDAKANCPVSKALAAVPITAEATLEL